MEILGMALMGLGGILTYVGLIWLIVVAFKEDQPIWGIIMVVTLLIPLTYWIVSLAFCLVTRKGWTQFIMMVAGTCLVAFGLATALKANGVI